jgi:hypothetical protein
MSKRKYTDIKELVGTVYNNFKIIDYKRENRRSLLLVECPHCHNRKWMRKEQIEIAKSCGCLNYKTFFKAQNIKGERFGNLTVLEPTNRRDKNNGSVVWRCVCDCGSLKEATEADLKRGAVRSCGCIARKFSRKNGKKVLTEQAKKVCVENTRLDNLTAAKAKNNTSGYKGVTWDGSRGKWRAQIVFKGKAYHLGRYNTIEQAAAARKQAEEELCKLVLEKYNYKSNKEN